MAIHDLFLGGARTDFRYPPSIFPQKDVSPDCEMHADDTRGNILYSISRRLRWKEAYHPVNCGTEGSDGLAQYIEANPIKVDDVINIAIIPRMYSLERVHVNIITGLAGFTFDVRVRGNAESLGGTVAVPAPVVLAAGVSGATIDSSLIVLPAPLYFNQNDMLQLVVKALPAAGIDCSDIQISPVVMRYCTGYN